MSSLGSPSTFFLAKKKAYEVERSLRFDGSSSYLDRTPSSASNRRTMTLSVWVKGMIGGTYRIFDAHQNDSNRSFVFFNDNGSISFFHRPGDTTCTTTGFYRDPSAWYHIVFAFDTTQSSVSNRYKIYINGVEQANNSNVPGQNTDLFFNSTNSHKIGVGGDDQGNENYFPGYMAEINFIDGQQYDPSYFAETDLVTGQWIPKKYIGGYGTNGFYLNFSDNSGTSATTLGKDESGNGNNYTPNNFSVAAGVNNDSVFDSPTNNFPTFNPVDPGSGSFTLSNGNMDLTTATGSSTTYATFVIPKTGKWFMEATMTNNGPNFSPWIVATNYLGLSDTSYTDSSLAYYINGQKRFNGSYSNYGATFTQNDVIGVAIDVDNNEVTFYKNGTSQGAISFTFASGIDYYFAATDGSSYGSGAYSWNFGQRPFVYTQPTGFETICSKNLPDPTIKLPNKHFDTLTYTGTDTSASRTLTGLNFSPDWIWQKRRNGTNWHSLMDQVRGVGKTLFSNDTSAEATNNQYGYLSAFTSDGFTWSPGSTNNSDGNETGGTFVSWCWNGGDTDGKTYTVTVVSDSGNKYRFDGFGTSAVTLDLAEGGTYIFNYPSAHPFRFSTTADGTHGGGSEYTTGVTVLSSTSVQIVVAASAPTLYYYCTIHSGMGGAINTNSTLGSSNFDGSIQSRAKVNATAGFSILTYTGTGSNATIGHGLGVTPNAIIVKRRNGTQNWGVYHSSIAPNDILQLDVTNSVYGGSGVFGNALATSSVFSVNAGSGMSNGNGDTYVAYCFSEVAGYSKFGSYKGNGSSEDGPFVFTNHRPAWIMFKNINTATWWFIYDVKRETFNVMNTPLSANVNDTEYSDSHYEIDILSNGFKIRGQQPEINKNGNTIVYFSFAESPFKNSRAR